MGRTKDIVTGLGVSLVLTAAGPALKADVPNVAVDIAPLHGLVAQVMGDLGTPSLILPQGASPHDHTLRPSEARALHNADMLFWTSDGLTPWLVRTLETRPADEVLAPMMARDGTVTHGFREVAIFGDGDGGHDHGHGGHDDHGHEEHAGDDEGHEDHAHGDEHAHKDDHGHEAAHGDEHAHEDHAHEDEHAHEEHADAHAHGDDHGHEEAHGHKETDAQGHDHGHDHAHDHGDGTDPHGWLDPQNASLWLGMIAEDLAAADPDNAETYRANAAAGQAEIAAATAQVQDALSGAGDVEFVVFHDAYQYFENRFGLAPLGAISLSDASAPGPAHLQELRAEVAKHGTVCIFAEPQFDPALAATVAEGSGGTVAVLDPLGQGIEPGPGFYPALLVSLGDAIAGCAETS